MIIWAKMIGDLVGFAFLAYIILVFWAKMTNRSIKEVLEDIGLFNKPNNTIQERVVNKFRK